MQVLEIKPDTHVVKMLIDRGELELIYQNLNDIDIKKDIKNILAEVDKK
jgi:hypothetical protein